MSYSFKVRGKTKADVIEQAEKAMEAVVMSQSAHRADKRAALSAIGVFVNAVGHKEGHDIEVSVNGSVSLNVTPAQPERPAKPAVEAIPATETSEAVPAQEAVPYRAPVPELHNVLQVQISINAYLVPEDTK